MQIHSYNFYKHIHTTQNELQLEKMTKLTLLNILFIHYLTVSVNYQDKYQDRMKYLYLTLQFRLCSFYTNLNVKTIQQLKKLHQKFNFKNR